jgi:hypothetical protein
MTNPPARHLLGKVEQLQDDDRLIVENDRLKSFWM